MGYSEGCKLNRHPFKAPLSFSCDAKDSSINENQGLHSYFKTTQTLDPFPLQYYNKNTDIRVKY